MIDNLSDSQQHLWNLLAQGCSNDEIAQQGGGTAGHISDLLRKLGTYRTQIMIDYVNQHFGTETLPATTLFDEAAHVEEPITPTRDTLHVYNALAVIQAQGAGPIACDGRRIALASLDASPVPQRTIRFMYMRALLGLHALSAPALQLYYQHGLGRSYDEIAVALGVSKQYILSSLRMSLSNMAGMNAMMALLDYHQRIPPTIQERTEARNMLHSLTSAEQRSARELTEYWVANAANVRNNEGGTLAAVSRKIGYADRHSVSQHVKSICTKLGSAQGNQRLVVRLYYVACLAPNARSV